MSIRSLVLAIVALSFTAGIAAERPGELSPALQAKLAASAAGDPELQRLINAVTNVDINALSLNRAMLMSRDNQFNVTVKNTKVSDQQSSGRCWMFAGTNLVTPKLMTKLQLSDFQLSENYLAFWDKLEKSNQFLETMITYRDTPILDRSVQMYLSDPIGDGGWWHYFTGLMRKYGVVPASAMPETKQSASTGRTNALISTLLRKGAAHIRAMADEGRKEPALREYKESVLADIYRVLVCGFGQPPAEFVFRWEEGKDSLKTLVEKTYTPKSFFDEHFAAEVPEYVAISNNPALAYGKLYQMDFSRNVWEAGDMQVLNLPVERLKQYTFKSLLDSQIVWFACDVGRDNYKDSGLFAVGILDYERTFGIDLDLPKPDRIRYKEMSPNHAMVLLGCDTTTAGVPRKWLVENSWGTKAGRDGLWTMYDSWFDENVLLVMIDKRLLDQADVDKLSQKPIIVADWEPFFSALLRLE